ncbi:MAG TPA: methylenetetrahydrofolate--tRNA-(uracil(54)-C(5))-methyltransferase (FADH(2)-oxidizing) TrmFO [Syntrophorhabdales bacterium]|nr:methylenetetrahydrofolate--tRNA-(uracil(54)-C(5))-methyltransferase (FADH(2)-oxidizing) TrmFO [Syntrophorhabdales bacterium]
MEVKVIGAGLAGTEAVYQLAKRGIDVTLYEMRPLRTTPAHKTGDFAELVCSNSLKSKELTNAHGLLKEELRLLDSLIIKTADRAAIPGGKALVVDRTEFSAQVTEAILSEKGVRVVREEVDRISDGVNIIATGPLTSEALSGNIATLTGEEHLHFFDAISPIVDGASVDMEEAFFGARYMSDADDYLNCPLTKAEYDRFYDELVAARRVDLRAFEDTHYFEGCLPIEVMAERGRQTLAYGPMKPVGIVNQDTGEQPYAVVQLRREDYAGQMYNLVGFQTKLTYPEQERVLRMIPALKDAVFLRYGSIHRNSFINAPAVLAPGLQVKKNPSVFFAGQITGVEGYVESTAMGLVAAVAVLCFAKGKPFIPPPPNTSVGALVAYVTTPRKDFQPMNINFGLLANYSKKRKEVVVRNALSSIAAWKEEIEQLW